MMSAPIRPLWGYQRWALVGLILLVHTEDIVGQTTAATQTSTAQFGPTAHTTGASASRGAITVARSCVQSLWCYCDLSNLCDLGCCCDPDCEQTVTDAFSVECSCDLPNEYAVPYCSNSDILVSNQTHLIKRPIGDLFCIVDDHVYKKDTYIEGKPLAEEEFHNRLRHLEAIGEFRGGNDEDVLRAAPRDGGLREGDAMKIRLDSGQVKNFAIPIAMGGDSCDVLSSVRYLRPRSSRCLVKFSCESQFSRMSYFVNPAFLVAGASSSVVQPLAELCLANKDCAPHSTEDLNKCSYFSRVQYRIVHNGTIGLHDVYIFLYREEQLAPAGAMVPLQLDVVFETKQDAVVRLNGGPTRRSGNPGYIAGKPVLIKNGESSTRPMSAPFRDCTDLDGGAVLFGQNVHSMCTFSTCEEVRDNLPTMLAGDGYAGSFGNSDPRVSDDWVLIDESSPINFGNVQNDSCSFRIEVTIAFQRTQFRINPQNRIVYVHVRYVVLDDPRPLVETVVDFVDMSDSPQIRYASPPVIDVRLPEDFFYPLTLGASAALRNAGHPDWLRIFTLLMFTVTTGLFRGG